MSWMILGSFGVWAGLLFHLWDAVVVREWANLKEDLGKIGLIDRWLFLCLLGQRIFSAAILAVVVCFTPAVGGMIVVGLMIKNFGQCTRI